MSVDFIGNVCMYTVGSHLLEHVRTGACLNKRNNAIEMTKLLPLSVNIIIWLFGFSDQMLQLLFSLLFALLRLLFEGDIYSF